MKPLVYAHRPCSDACHLIPYSFKAVTATSPMAEFFLKTVPAFSLDILCCSVLKT